jgi:FkbM family methyltransferase
LNGIKRILKEIAHSLGFDIIRYAGNPKSSSKKTNKLSYHATKTGNYFLPTDAKNDIIIHSIVHDQIFEKEVMDIASKFIQPGKTVLDIGSNFGQMSILFSNLVGNQGKVHAFEADDWVFNILTKNIMANKKEGIIIPHFGAVHHVDGETLYYPEQDFIEFQTYGSYGIDYNAGEGRAVKSLTIDSLNIHEEICFMKVDIQGSDLQAMKGAVQTIMKNRMPIIFEYEYRFEDRFNMRFQEYVDFVRDIDYKFEKVINGQNYLIIPK